MTKVKYLTDNNWDSDNKYEYIWKTSKDLESCAHLTLFLNTPHFSHSLHPYPLIQASLSTLRKVRTNTGPSGDFLPLFSLFFQVQVQVELSRFPPTTLSHSNQPHIPPSTLPHLALSMGPLYRFPNDTSPSFPCHPLLPSPLVTVSLFFNSMSLVIFLLACLCVDEVPLIGEIIWYFSFTTWLISLSMMLSSSIHAVAKGISSFFLFAV